MRRESLIDQPAYHGRKWMRPQPSSQLPMSQSIHELRDRSAKKQHDDKASLWKLLPCFILVLLPWITIKRSEWQLLSVKDELGTMRNEQKTLFRKLDKTTGILRDLGRDSERLGHDNDKLFRVLQKNGVTPDLENEQYAQVEQVEDAMLKRIDDLEKHIQENSAKAVVDAYGIGPHRVQVIIKDQADVSYKFVIELAMLMEMPHAVHHFLRMVDLRLWDGLSLVHGIGLDYLMATPMTLDSHEWERKRFVDANLTHMAYTEFSETYSPPDHHKYSVAFAGRPGGPEFYVNLEEHPQFSEHESVFGIVSEGRDVIDKLFSQRAKKTRNHDDIFTIESIRLSSQ
jgi:cyclophilin family peptidyl-prolyl cis-trans isomerase